MKRQFIFLILVCTTSTIWSQRIKSATFQSWVDGSWENSRIIYRSYDSNGFLSQTKNDSWNPSISSWIDFIVTNYDNDNQGNSLQSTSEQWDSVSGTWNNRDRAINLFNNDGNRTSNILQNFKAGKWVNFLKDSSIYNGSGHLITRNRYNWDTINNQWNLLSRYTYTNNPDGVYTEFLEESWNSLTMSWENANRETRIINADNSVSSSIYSSWEMSAWIDQSRQQYDYDNNGYLISLSLEYWDTFNSKWVYLSRDSLNNFSDGRLDTRITRRWDNLNNVWENAQKVIMTYEESTGVTENLEEWDIEIYPNPASNELFLKSADVQQADLTIMDVTGKVLISQSLTQSIEQIDISNLSAGSYVLTLRNATKYASRKLLITR